MLSPCLPAPARPRLGHLQWRYCLRFPCRRCPLPSKLQPMIRWFIVIFLVLVCISWVSPLLQKLGFGKLPGDLRFRLFGREWFIPLATTILLSLVASLISQLI